MLISSTSYRRYGTDPVVVRRAGRTNARRTDGRTRVCVRGGPFCGMAGILLHQPPDRPAIVRVNVLGRPVDLEIQPNLLKTC